MAGNILSTSIRKDSRADALAAVDVYGTGNPTAPVNNIIPKQVTRLFTPKNNQQSILGEIKSAIGSGNIVEKLTSLNDIYSRVGDVLEGSKTGLASLPSSKLKSLMALLNIEDSTLGKMTVAGVNFRNLKNKDAKSTVRFLESILGDNDIAEYFDGNSTFALLKTAIEMAQELGVPDLVQKILDKAEDSRLKVKLMAETLPSSVRTSNLDSVNRIIDELGVSKCFTIMPDIIESLMQYYRIPSNNTKTVDQLRTQVVGILNRLDIRWDKGTMNGQDVYSIEKIAGCSADFASIWPSIDTVTATQYTTNPEDSYTAAQKEYVMRCQLVQHARTYRPASAYQLARNAYPKAKFLGT